MDFFADNLVKKIIGQIIENQNDLPNEKQLWISTTRQMFHNYPAHEVINLVYQCLEEAADEDWFEKKWLKDKTFPKRDMDYKQKKKSVIKLNLKKSAIRKTINDNLKIIDVAKSYGLKVKRNMTICPFHVDKDPSLSLSNELNVFNCFGCSAKGDIIEFIRRMENINKKGVKENGKLLELRNTDYIKR